MTFTEYTEAHRDLTDLRKAWRVELRDNRDAGDEFAAKGTEAILAMIDNDLRHLNARAKAAGVLR